MYASGALCPTAGVEMAPQQRSIKAPHACASMRWAIENSRFPLRYDPALREYLVLPIDDEQSDQLVFQWCPFCGQRLPPSLRDEWFERLWELGLTGPEDPRVPEEMRSDRWWSQA